MPFLSPSSSSTVLYKDSRPQQPPPTDNFFTRPCSPPLSSSPTPPPSFYWERISSSRALPHFCPYFCFKLGREKRGSEILLLPPLPPPTFLFSVMQTQGREAKTKAVDQLLLSLFVASVHPFWEGEGYMPPSSPSRSVVTTYVQYIRVHTPVCTFFPHIDPHHSGRQARGFLAIAVGLCMFLLLLPPNELWSLLLLLLLSRAQRPSSIIVNILLLPPSPLHTQSIYPVQFWAAFFRFP